ncbi:MAG: trypsin-like serine protease [Bacteroidota bacterium]
MIFFFALTLSGLLSVAGIYRHDRPQGRYIDLAHKKQFDCVGEVWAGKSKRGSCVLIGKTFVLSAAHVFFNDKANPDKQFYCAFNGVQYHVKNIINHTLYSKLGDYDISILELSMPIDDISPAALCATDDELGADVTGVGFGSICQVDSPSEIIANAVVEKTTSGKFAGENVIDSIGGYSVNNIGAILYCDFDCPPGSKYSGQCDKMGSSIPKDLEYYVNGGDSGGGLFRQTAKGWELVGICSGGGMNLDQFEKTYYYGHIMRWTRVSTFISWIEECEQNTMKTK